MLTSRTNKLSASNTNNACLQFMVPKVRQLLQWGMQQGRYSQTESGNSVVGCLITGQLASSLDVQEPHAMHTNITPHLIWNALRGAIALALLGFMGGIQAKDLGDPKGDEKTAKPVATAEDYIDRWQEEAVHQMMQYGIPASITLAQGILESGNGVSELAQKSNNHFGIKCHATWTGKRTYHDDDAKGECFRVYDDAKDSYEDHSQFLLRDRYARLFDLKLTDYEGWAKGLKACGYATDPAYADRLITLIERHDLHLLDQPGGSIPSAVASNDSREVRRDKTKEHTIIRKADNGGGTLNLDNSHRIRTTVHGVQFVFVEPGDTQESLARSLNMMPWQIRTYNEISKEHVFHAGDKLYLQPKKNHADHPWHTVREGQTLWQISQLHGVRTKSLARKNHLEPDAPLRAGMRLSLQWPLTKDGRLPFYARPFVGN